MKSENYMFQYACWIVLLFSLYSTLEANNATTPQNENSRAVIQKREEQIADEPVVDDAYIASCQKYLWRVAIVTAIGALVILGLKFSLTSYMETVKDSTLYLIDCFFYACFFTVIGYLPALQGEIQMHRGSSIKTLQIWIWTSSIMYIMTIFAFMLNFWTGIKVFFLFPVGISLTNLVFWGPKIAIYELLMGLILLLTFLCCWSLFELLAIGLSPNHVNKNTILFLKVCSGIVIVGIVSCIIYMIVKKIIK